ncbi:MAG: hypothetical protein DRQ52_01915 [Gammaproteobacteria bacterium]|nr:MAG: hypothetical protein DRQ52_01915 [Gammaproteobacteria bacterium]
MIDEHLHRKIDALENELAALRGEFSEFIDTAANYSNDTENAEDAQPSSSRLERDLEKTAGVARLALHELDEASKRYPTASLLVAFTTGLLISRLFGRSRR